MKASAAWVLSIAAAAAVVGSVAILAARRGRASRCPAPLIALQARCCAPGQSLQSGRCVGPPLACPEGFDRISDGCVVRRHRVRINPGHLQLGPGDWEAQGVVEPHQIAIAVPYWLDSHEATVADWNRCVDAGGCEERLDDEPGRPVRGRNFQQALRFCQWAGGALPTHGEWIFAAAGPHARRYPWGDTGAVCSRASWGLAAGPCSREADGPDWAGMAAGDLTPDGVADMAASVSEWVRRDPRAPATAGGSWSSSFAAELRTWHAIERDPSLQSDQVGVRCRYDSG